MSQMLTKYPTAVAMFEAAAERNPDGGFIRYFDSTLTYREVDRQSSIFAAALAKHGFSRGDRLGIQAQSLPQAIIAMLATWKLGGVFVAMNPMYRPREVALLLNDAKPVVFMAEPQLLNDVFDRLPDGTHRPEIVLSADALAYGQVDSRIPLPKPPSTSSYEDFGAYIQCHEHEVWKPRDVSPDDIAALIYTSGTTGLPKGAIITQGGIALGGALSRDAHALPEKGNVLALAPLFHVSGVVMSVATAIHAAAAVIVNYRFHPDVVVEIIEKHAPEAAAGPITAFIAIMNAKGATREAISKLKIPMSGGAPVPAAVADAYEERFGVALRTGYGLTETSGAAFMEPHSERRRIDPNSGSLSVGKLLPSFEAMIVDENGISLDTGGVGEIVLRGPCVSPGYWRNPEDSARAMCPDGFYTGDVGFFDADGWLYLIDRKKDVIIAGGYKIWPREVEDVIYSHPAVLEVAVVGVADSYRGETVKAVISLKPGAKVDESEITDLCREKLAAYKVPRLVEIIDELPKNPAGKILRRELRE